VDFGAVACLHKASAVLGKFLDLVPLITAKSLRPHGETTLDDLSAMARAQGLQADSYSDLTVAQLRRADFPALLRVRGSRYSAKPDHYVVCLGIEDGQARIFNPPGTEATFPLECLATRWKGEALVLSAGGPRTELSALHYASYVPTLALIGVAIAAIVVLRLLRRVSRGSPAAAMGRLSRLVIQPIGIIAAAVALGYAGRMYAGADLQSHAAVLASSGAYDAMDFLLRPSDRGSPEGVSEIDLRAALKLHDAGALFVDARDYSEYASGHIKRAMCVPASEASLVRMNMAGIAKNRKIVVYCSDVECGRAHYIAAALMQNGFTEVVLYPEGWVKWSGDKELKS
jgi:rhodanese-related sulfurtransferase